MVTQVYNPYSSKSSRMATGHAMPQNKDPHQLATERRSFQNNLRADVIAIAEQMVNWLFSCSPQTDKQPTTGNGLPNNNLPSLSSFIRSVVHRTQSPVTAIITALIYLCRLKQRHPSCKGSPGAGHRLILAALITATKYLYDDAYHNRSWVTVSQGLFNLSEINQMEMEFLVFLNFRLSVTRDQWCEFVAIIDEKLQSHWQRTGLWHVYQDMGFSLMAEVIENPIARRGEKAGPPMASTMGTTSIHPPGLSQEASKAGNSAAHPHPWVGSNSNSTEVPRVASGRPTITTYNIPPPAAVSHGSTSGVRTEFHPNRTYSPTSACVTPINGDTKVTPSSQIKLYRKPSSNSFRSVPSSSGTISVKPSPPHHFRTPTTPNSPFFPGTHSGMDATTTASTTATNYVAHSKGQSSVVEPLQGVPVQRHVSVGSATTLNPIKPLQHPVSPYSAGHLSAGTGKGLSGFSGFRNMLKSKRSANSLYGNAFVPPSQPPPPPSGSSLIPPPINPDDNHSRFSPAGLKLAQRFKALSFLRPSTTKLNLTSKSTGEMANVMGTVPEPSVCPNNIHSESFPPHLWPNHGGPTMVKMPGQDHGYRGENHNVELPPAPVAVGQLPLASQPAVQQPYPVEPPTLRGKRSIPGLSTRSKSRTRRLSWPHLFHLVIPNPQTMPPTHH
ncbi:hypothetical protein IWQ62_003047 [Dispira parvispora]|uniref:Cyclin N-terminal domain-containing protein n=1 Tax=Dispira parvispora TaxID=1520584 RepID=A0A9W8E6M2_9FUNG|nr:hypothetical protein IWQ62_003047 [Dispira parvispora]